jgi:hypothetical protein
VYCRVLHDVDVIMILSCFGKEGVHQSSRLRGVEFREGMGFPEVFTVGDLNGDHVDDAVLFFNYWQWQIPSKYSEGYLAVALNRDGVPVPLKPVGLGYSYNVKVTIESGLIILDRITVGMGGAMCWPNQHERQTFAALNAKPVPAT